MVGACLTSADEEDNLPTWQNQPPLDLTVEMAMLGTLHTATAETAALLGSQHHTASLTNPPRRG